MLHEGRKRADRSLGGSAPGISKWCVPWGPQESRSFTQGLYLLGALVHRTLISNHFFSIMPFFSLKRQNQAAQVPNGEPLLPVTSDATPTRIRSQRHRPNC